MPENGLRDPSIVREELQDLVRYLEGLPAVLRRSGAFLPYEQRAGELSRELILSEMLLFTHQMPGSLSSELTAATEYRRLQETLSTLTQTYERSAKQSRLASHVIHWGVLVASAGSLISGISAATSLVIPFSGAAASLAALYVLRFAKRARQQELLLSYLADLREEITHSFGPSGEVLRPSEYYPASTRRIERLLDDLRVHVARGPAAPGTAGLSGV